MSYRKAETILPMEIIELIQKYVDGESIYIPKKENCRKPWGEGTSIREELQERNSAIYLDYRNGLHVEELAEKYFLSEKSIRRIVYRMRDMS